MQTVTSSIEPLAVNLLNYFDSLGIQYGDHESMLKELSDAINRGQYQFIKKGEDVIGFFTWLIVDKCGIKNIYIANMLMRPEFKGKYQFLRLRKFFRDKYPDYKMLYWHDQKKDKYYYTH